MIENVTPQPYPLHAIEPGEDTPLLVIGWTGSVENDDAELLRPLVVFNSSDDRVRGIIEGIACTR